MKEGQSVDEYVSTFPPDVQSVLQKLRKTVRKTAPNAEEVISYRIIGYRLNGRLVWFAAFKDHIGFYPTLSPFEKFKKEIAPYKSGKGTIRFALSKPIPYDLVGKITKFRVNENLKKKAKTSTPKRKR